jgi:hypothetical protein
MARTHDNSTNTIKVMMATAGQRCVHGIDSRFCAVCNRVSRVARPRAAIGSVPLPEILAFLEAEHIRAKPKAIADALGVGVRTLAGQLDTLAAADAGAPIIATGTELLLRLTAWKAARKD